MSVAPGGPHPADHGEAEDVYDLTPTQFGMLVHVLRDPASPAFVAQGVLPLGNLDPEMLGDAWRELVAGHEVLRTSFAWEHRDHPVQVVHRSVELPLEVRDWRTCPRAGSPRG